MSSDRILFREDDETAFSVNLEDALRKDMTPGAKAAYLTLCALKATGRPITRDTVKEYWIKGKASFENALKELRKMGYLSREYRRGPTGKIEASYLIFSKSPMRKIVPTCYNSRRVPGNTGLREVPHPPQEEIPPSEISSHHSGFPHESGPSDIYPPASSNPTEPRYKIPRSMPTANTA